jgi:hypothetical protein
VGPIKVVDFEKHEDFKKKEMWPATRIKAMSCVDMIKNKGM